MSETNEKKEMPAPGNRGKKISKIAMITVAVIATVALLAVGAWNLLVVPPDVSGNNNPGATEQGETNTGTGDAATGENISDQQKEPADPNGRKKDYYTFILLGKDTGGGSNTDTMLLVSYDVPGKTMDIMSIPRDTMINVPWKIKKINAVYASSRGVEGLKKELGHLTGVTPDFYVAIEWEAIGEIVDALGGVWFDVPYNMNYDDPYQDLYIHQEKGYRFLNGQDAMQVIRWRKNNGEEYGIGDSGRQQVQQDFLKAVAKQCLQIKNWTKVSAFAEIFFKNIETDIPWNNVLWFAQQAMGIDMENINFHSLPGNDQGWYYTPSIGSNLAYFFADPVGIVEVVNAHFNPFNRDITEEDLQIVYKNKDASLGITNGELADPKMAIPSVKPSSPPKKETEDPTPPEGESEEGTEAPGEGSEGTVPSGEGGETGETTETGESGTETGGETNVPSEGENDAPSAGESEVPADGESGEGETADTPSGETAGEEPEGETSEDEVPENGGESSETEPPSEPSAEEEPPLEGGTESDDPDTQTEQTEQTE